MVPFSAWVVSSAVKLSVSVPLSGYGADPSPPSSRSSVWLKLRFVLCSVFTYVTSVGLNFGTVYSTLSSG